MKNLKPVSDSTFDVGRSTFDLSQMIKNVPFAEALDLGTLVSYQPAQVVSRTIARTKYVNISIFAFSKGEGLSTHSSTGDAMIQVIDGIGEFTVGEQASVTVAAGQSILLPANVPHAVNSPQDFKMLLTVIKPV
ncbi:MAG TPA: cupin domain-containing protein [Opitutae bacterium]|nr:cupin domain-containing protein [Opitutae bacterium]